MLSSSYGSMTELAASQAVASRAAFAVANLLTMPALLLLYNNYKYK
jgi:hypothetical protein